MAEPPATFPSRTVHRFGGLNVRAALRWVRDAPWAELDATSPEGYRPDRVRVLFTGTSAGAYGVAYNYHWVLDDLRWPRTTAVPDSGLGLDNGELIGIGSLGFFVLLNEMPPIAWSARTLLPPYCFAPTCGVGPVLLAATAPRLEMMPEQQVLSVSNQVDSTQVATTFFDTTAHWIDALRTAYCATQGLPGLHYFMPANPASIHGIVASTPRFTTMASGGVVMRDWLADAVAAPGAVVDRVEEGGLVGTHGVMPFACPVEIEVHGRPGRRGDPGPRSHANACPRRRAYAARYIRSYSRAARSHEKSCAIARRRMPVMCCGRSCHVESAQPMVLASASGVRSRSMKPVPPPVASS